MKFQALLFVCMPLAAWVIVIRRKGRATQAGWLGVFCGQFVFPARQRRESFFRVGKFDFFIKMLFNVSLRQSEVICRCNVKTAWAPAMHEFR